MPRMKKPVAFLVVAAVSAGGALVGNGLLKDVQFARAKDAVESTRSELHAADAVELSNIFRKVGKVMEPSVVNIMVHKAAKTGARALPFGDDDALRKLFPDRDGDGEPDLPDGFGDGSGPEDLPRESIGTGSGVILAVEGGSGYILTNNHVAGGATEMTITLADGREIKNGKLLGTDPKTDLAVIEIKEQRLLPAKWGDSDSLERGDFVMAFGSPFGYVGSMTHGIVSALNRQAGILDRQGYESFIQVDCPINPGNSGGPLTNLKGEVVGINTAIASRSGGFQGIGFAIPSNQAKYVFEQLKSQGKVTRGWLGVGISDVSSDLPKAKSFGYDGNKGVLVEQTFTNTPAAGRLQPGDIVTEVDGAAVDDVQELRNKIAATAPNKTLKMRVFRDGKFETVDVTVGEQPDDIMAVAGRPGARGSAAAPQQDKASSTLGLRFANPTDPGVERFGLKGSKGAVVMQVLPNSAAAKAGIRPGDVVTKVGGQDVASGSDAVAALSKQDLSKGVRLYVTTGNTARFVFVAPEEK